MKKFFQIAAFALVGFVVFTSAKLSGQTYYEWDGTGSPNLTTCIEPLTNILPVASSPNQVYIIFKNVLTSPSPLTQADLQGEELQAYLTRIGRINFDCRQVFFVVE